jgi:hypothetical protein
MRVYRFCWWGLVLPLAGLGMLVAVLALPLGDVLLRVYAGVLVGPAASLLVADLLKACSMTTRRSSAAVAGAISLVAAAGVRVVVGEGAMLLLAALLVLTSPVAGRCYALLLRARLRPVRTSGPAREAPPVILTWPLLGTLAVRQLTDEELATAWRHSCAVLPHVVDPDQWLGWVLARQAYLDELERRWPEGVAPWITAGLMPTEASRRLPQPPDLPELDAR